MAAATIDTQLIRKSRPESAWRQGQDLEMEMALGKGKLCQAEGDNRWRAILCLHGALWITQERDLRDHVIEAGEMFLISQPGKVVIMACVDARLQITPSLATMPCQSRSFDQIIFP